MENTKILPEKLIRIIDVISDEPKYHTDKLIEMALRFFGTGFFSSLTQEEKEQHISNIELIKDLIEASKELNNTIKSLSL